MSCDGLTEKGDLAVMATLIGSFWIKNMRRNCLLFDNDLTLAYILGEIGMYNVSHMHAQLSRCAALPGHLDVGMLYDVLKPCNAYSIAAATGLPRETVRRKIVRLEELGWVRRLPEGGVIVSARCIEHTYSQACPEVFYELLDTVKHLRRHLPPQWFE